MAQHNDFGKLGEQLAANLLLGKGYKILERNYRYQKAEIDIIAEINNTLIIIEVKARSSERVESILETVTYKKIKLLVLAADNYASENNLDFEIRFDIVTILKKEKKIEINHIEDAFTHF